jgi:alpha-D-ribose 1-methylphosphonate 5-triphosphate diphosphatase
VQRIDILAGTVLAGASWRQIDLRLEDGFIGDRRPGAGAAVRTIDASGLLVLPGMVDIHGDAFERQLMPRPHVAFDEVLALLDTDRQLAANGITTALHGVTWSWEPGLRGAPAVRRIVAAIEALAPRFAVDTRCHLRHETFNLEAESEIVDWMGEGRIACLAFNDHMAGTIKVRKRSGMLRTMIERSGLSDEAFDELAERIYARRDEVPASIARLARAAGEAGVPTLSHDDLSPEDRAWHRSLGCRVAEFPVGERTAAAAAEAGDRIVFGAPNVVRGGSHNADGCRAADMVARGLCDVLASDYYYPALLAAPFRLARDGVRDLASAWRLVAAHPADALGLHDRGTIEVGKRADLVLVEQAEESAPSVVATIVRGRIVHLTDATRLA